MGRLIYTKNAPLSFFDWRMKNIVSIYAGHSCVMAITKNGEVLQRVLNKELAARTEYWKNIRSISVSQSYPALAVGLVKDGTCIIGKKVARYYCKNFGGNFEQVNSSIKELKDIIQICVSDAIFALDKYGKVHCIVFGRKNEYHDISQWENIVGIAVGNQASIFGITREGNVLCSGHNCISGPHGDIREKLATFRNVRDICALGSECERILLAFENGNIADLDGNSCGLTNCGKTDKFYSNFGLAAVHSAEKYVKFVPYFCAEEELEKFQDRNISSIAVGVDDGNVPFVVALE